MKMFLRLWVLLPLFFIGCTLSEEGCIGSDEFSDNAHYVSLSDARQTVESMLGSIDNATRGGKVRTVCESFTFGGADTRNDEEESPVYHIFNFSDSEGFAIASADDRTPPVVCITDSGTFSADTRLDNGGVAMALDAYDTAYRVTAGMPVPDCNGGLINPGDPGYPNGTGFGTVVPGTTINIGGGGGTVTRRAYAWVLSSTAGTEIACRWGQEAPYNNMMPLVGAQHCMAGCGAVAVAQVLYHYGYPASIERYSLNWTVLRRHISNREQESYQPAHAMLARLFQQLNTSAYLDPSSVSVDATGVLTKNIAPAFRKLGFQCGEETNYSGADVISAIRAGRPVILSGYALRTPVKVLGMVAGYHYQEGHYWVCDRLTSYSRKYETYKDGKLINTEYEYMHYFHCNWGWDGRWNGYFFTGAFDAYHEPSPPTRNTEGESGYYRYNLKMWNQIKR